MKSEDIFKALPSLSAKDLKQVKARVEFFLQSEKKKEDVELDWLTEGILYEAERRGLGGYLVDRKKLLTNDSYVTSSAKVRDYLLERSTLRTKVELKVLGRIAAEALADYLNYKSLSVKRLLFCIRQVPTALDASFPGYVQGRALDFLVRKTSEKEHEPRRVSRSPGRSK